MRSAVCCLLVVLCLAGCARYGFDQPPDSAPDVAIPDSAPVDSLVEGEVGPALCSVDGWCYVPVPVEGARLLGIWGVGGDIIVVGEGGTVLRRRDQHWTPLAEGVPGSSYLEAVWGPSASDLFVVGRAGLILRYTDGSWNEMESSTGASLFDVWGSGPSEVFAAGDGVLLRYDGASWEPQLLESPDPDLGRIEGIWGDGPSRVYAVGEYGHIWRRESSAWVFVDTKTTVTLSDVFGAGGAIFVSARNGSTVLHHDEVSTAWTKRSYGTTHPLYALWGDSPSDVYAVGGEGTIARWDGASWKPQHSGTTNSLMAIWGDADAIYTVGTSSTLLRKTR